MHSIFIRLSCMLAIVFFMSPVATATEPIAATELAKEGLDAAVEGARTELSARKTWARSLPPLKDFRRNGHALVVGLDLPAITTPRPWKEWWEQAVCYAPELKKILLLDGAILVYRYGGPEQLLNESIFFTKSDCYARVADWNTKSADNRGPKPFPGYKLETKKEPAAPKPGPDDPLGLATTFATLNQLVVEFQLKTAENPDTADRIAVFKKNLLTSLLKKGFTRTEAVSIVNSTAIPSLWR